MVARLNLAMFIFIFLTVISKCLNKKYVLKHQGSSKDHFRLEKYKIKKLLRVLDTSWVQPFFLRMAAFKYTEASSQFIFVA